MKCPVCGSGYRGLAGDCDCTSYSGGEPRDWRVIPEYMRTVREQLAAIVEGDWQARKGPGTEPKKPIEPTPPLTGRAPLVLDGREI